MVADARAQKSAYSVKRPVLEEMLGSALFDTPRLESK